MAARASALSWALTRLSSDSAFLALSALRTPYENAAALIAGLDSELVAIGGDPSVRVVVIAGAGPAFCAGHDLREIRANPDHAAIQALFANPTPLIAAAVIYVAILWPLVRLTAYIEARGQRLRFAR